MPALEMLGAATVLCVDKTGTLTHNRMAMAALYADGRHFDLSRRGHEALPEVFHALLEFGMLASHRDPFDPMEQAIKQAIEAKLENTEHIHRDWTLVDEYPLTPQQLAMSRVWQSPDREHYVIAAKGSPEAVLDLCHLPIDAAQRLGEEAARMVQQGLRVLGVARATFRKAELPPIQHDFDFEFLGLLGLADRTRSRHPRGAGDARSHAVWWVAGSALLILALAHAVPVLRTLFFFDRLRAADLWLIPMCALGSVVAFEFIRRVAGGWRQA
jgi:Ca2+-transporting ATPase